MKSKALFFKKIDGDYTTVFNSLGEDLYTFSKDCLSAITIIDSRSHKSIRITYKEVVEFPDLPSFLETIKVSSIKMKGEISANNYRIRRPPFSMLSALSKVLPQKYFNNIEQNISDMRIEYFEALVEKNVWRARCIVGFYYAGLGWSVVMWIAQRSKELLGFTPKIG